MKRSGQVPDTFMAWATYIVTVAVIVIVTTIIILQATDNTVEPLMGGAAGCWAGYRIGGPLTCTIGAAGGAYGVFMATTDQVNFDIHLSGSIDQRETGMAMHTMLQHRPGGGETVREKIQRYFGCQSMSDPPYDCSGTDSIPDTVRDAVADTVPGDRTYFIQFQYRGEAFTAPEDPPSITGNKAQHTTIVPMPGGRRIRIVAQFEGARGGVRWGG